jgi:aminoglycoside phosphotransferase (APT) family kinase protein
MKAWVLFRHGASIKMRDEERKAAIEIREVAADISDLPLPKEFELYTCTENRVGELNNLYLVKGKYQGKPLTAYLKFCKNPSRSLINEYNKLYALASSGIPAPKVLWASEARTVLLLEALEGNMVWDSIDPRRGAYDRQNAFNALRQCGEMLGKLHALQIECAIQPRTRMYALEKEEQEADDPRFQQLSAWLNANEIAPRDYVFVHGDYNTANILINDGAITGIVDWEFAGRGWKEYELAWSLRARMAFLNTQAEREAFLAGYCKYNQFNLTALCWCEVMNYLHDAWDSKKINSPYYDFSLERALELIR